MGTSFSMARAADSCSSSMERGRMNHLAGPPILYQVRGASGSFSVTNSSRPENGLTVVSFIDLNHRSTACQSPRHFLRPSSLLNHLRQDCCGGARQFL